MAKSDGSLLFDTKIDSTGLSGGVKQLGSLAAKGIMAVTAAMGAGVAASIAFGSEFETGMAKVGTIADTSKASMQELSDGIIALSSESGQSASDLSNALYEALSAGIDTSKAIEFTATANKLAVAGFTDSASAVDALTTVMNGYKMSADEATAVSDMMLQTQNKGKTTVDELASSLAQVTPTAAAMSVGFDQVSAALATMTAQGVPTAQATTQLNSLFAELGKSGTVANEAFQEATKGTKYAGKSFQQLMKEGVPLNDVLDTMGDYAGENGKSLLDMFSSIEAGKAALTMSGDSAKMYSDNLLAMRDSAGLTEEGYAKMMDTFDAKMGILKESGKNLGIIFYEGIQEPLKGIADVGIDALNRLTASFQKDGVQGLAVTGSQIITELLNGMIKELPKIVSFAVQIMGELIKGLVSMLPTILQTAIDIVLALAQGISEMLPTLIPLAMQALIDFSQTFFDNLPMIIETGCNLMKSLVDGVLEAIPLLLENLPTIVSNLANGILESAPMLITTAFELMQTLSSGLLEAIPLLIQSVPGIIGGLVGAIINNLPTIISSGIQLIGSLVTGILSNLGSIAACVPEMFTTLFTAITETDWLKLGSDIISGISKGFMDGIGGFIKDAKKGLDDFVGGIADFFGIHSPSRLMRDEIGKYIPMGMEVGISDQLPKSMRSVKRNLNVELDALRNEAINFSTNTDYVQSVSEKIVVEAENNESYDYDKAADKIADKIGKSGIPVKLNKREIGRMDKEAK